MSATPAIELRRVSKQYSGPLGQLALADISLRLPPGELVALVGKSGSGKSTLLNLLAGLDRPSTGEVEVAGTAVHALGENALAGWRSHAVGIVFQFFQLLPTLTAIENVILAMEFLGKIPRRERRDRAYGLLELVGLADQAHKLPATLSGGQQQRAAIARALANDPPLLLCDEPTGNLDSHTAAAVLDLFCTLVARGKTLLLVTHDAELAQRAHRIIRLADGRVVDERVLTAHTQGAA